MKTVTTTFIRATAAKVFYPFALRSPSSPPLDEVRQGLKCLLKIKPEVDEVLAVMNKRQETVSAMKGAVDNEKDEKKKAHLQAEFDKKFAEFKKDVEKANESEIEFESSAEHINALKKIVDLVDWKSEELKGKFSADDMINVMLFEADLDAAKESKGS